MERWGVHVAFLVVAWSSNVCLRRMKVSLVNVQLLQKTWTCNIVEIVEAGIVVSITCKFTTSS